MNTPSFSAKPLIFGMLWALVCFATALGIHLNSQSKVIGLMSRKENAMLAIEALHHVSEESTRLTRSFLVTGELTYRRKRDELIGAFKGYYPSPAEEDITYWWTTSGEKLTTSGIANPHSARDSILENILPEWPVSLLDQAFGRLEGIFDLELKAMVMPTAVPSVMSPERLQQMFSQQYNDEKQALMMLLYEFRQDISRRFATEISSASNRGRLSLYAMALAGLTLVLLGVLYLERLLRDRQKLLTRLHGLDLKLLRHKTENLVLSEPVSKPVDLGQLVESCRSASLIVAIPKGIGFQAAFLDKAPGARALGDLDCLTDLLQVLLDIAFDSTSKGEVSLLLTLSEVSEGQGELSVVVEDTGHGFSECAAKRILEPSAILENCEPEPLVEQEILPRIAALKHMIDALHGHFDVKSQLGAGSCFEVRLPIKLMSAPGAPKIMASPCDRPDSLAGKNIMVVDDHEINLRICQRVLEKRGARVEVFQTAQKALGRLADFSQQSFDVVLMDLQMPDMDGCEALRRIRVIPELAQLPVVAFTADQTGADKARTENLDFAAVMYKPLDTDEVCHLLHALAAQPVLFSN